MIRTVDHFVRQAELVPRDKLQALGVTVLGVGAVGRQVALQLAALGAGRIQLVDFDRVEPTNVTTQAYWASDLRQLKVDATRNTVLQIDPAIQVETVADRFRPTLAIGEVVFCCVDSISARGAIWRSVGSRCRFWSDGRMLGEVIRVLSAVDDAGRDRYGQTLFPQSEAQAGRCTAQSTIYTANIAAGLMLHQFTRWLRDLPVEADVLVNLLASEWSTNSPSTTGDKS